MKKVAAVLLGLSLAVPALAASADVVEPKTGVKFEEKRDGMTLLGAGLRIKKMVFSFKVYVAGLYVADDALASLKGKTGAALAAEVVKGDFKKEVVLKLVRDLSASKMQEAIGEALELQGTPKAKIDVFEAYFGDIKEGEQYVVRYLPGGTLETYAKGVAKPPIQDKAFADDVFKIWLGDKPIQEDLKAAMVSRAPEVLK